MKPIVAIVGRPNVGKSALFNKLAGRRKAITRNEPGTTRDRNYTDAEALGRLFTLVDTGGFEPEDSRDMNKKVREQARLAIEEAEVIVFLMDGRIGPATGDREIAEELRRSGKKVIYAVNKIDTRSLIPHVNDFYGMGSASLMPVSAEHGLGVDELLTEIVKLLPDEEPVEEAPAGCVRVAIVGRPNAGKSSLLNRLIGKERSIVSSEPGTTRDPVDTPLERDGKKYLFVDTAGIRKKQRIARTIEIYSVIEAIKSIDRSDVAVLVIDGVEGPSMQDSKIAGIIEEKGKPCVIAVNKWDIVNDEENDIEQYTERVRHEMPFISYAPAIFISALTGRRVSSVFGVVDKVMAEAATRISTSKLNAFIQEFSSRVNPPAYRGKEVKFYYMTQTNAVPPVFLIFTNYPEGVTDAYRRYLANSLRESLGLRNVPIRFSFRKRH